MRESQPRARVFDNSGPGAVLGDRLNGDEAKGSCPHVGMRQFLTLMKAPIRMDERRKKGIKTAGETGSNRNPFRNVKNG
jgi:hypothetical protein